MVDVGPLLVVSEYLTDDDLTWVNAHLDLCDRKAQRYMSVNEVRTDWLTFDLIR